MAKPYALEMSRLGQTLAWANDVEINHLSKAVRTSATCPLISVGSGGSLSAAHAHVFLHQRWTNKISKVATPLEVVAGEVDTGASYWLLSAGGGNVDILSAFRAVTDSEPRQVGILCGKATSALAEAAREHPFVDLTLFEPPAGKDGFLATNSLLGFAALLTRAYVDQYGDESSWSKIKTVVEKLVSPESPANKIWQKAANPLWKRNTTVVLHGTSTSIGAVDLESKFTEAAIGNLQLADYRNFAHGRHHWLAKHAETSGVVAFITENDRALAEKTLAQIPKDIPVARFEFEGEQEATQLASLICAFQLTGYAGQARNIDPGQPGVPTFGRRLYHLSLPKSKSRRLSVPLSPRDQSAIRRKTGQSVQVLDDRGSLKQWSQALASFKSHMLNAKFHGVVLDYDGTVVETRDRFEKPTPEMASALIEVVKSGATLAIATGRGSSVRRDLQAIMPAKLWSKVVVGYYNGAEVAPLSDDSAPNGSDGTCNDLAAVASALGSHPELARSAKQTNRQFQITLEAKKSMPENRLWDIAHEVLLSAEARTFKITRSSHSIDIVHGTASKKNVLQPLTANLGNVPILVIGDRGRWPGNDFELLREPYALSVDEVSADPATCWNLGDCGQRGMHITLQYLEALSSRKGRLAFRKGAFD